MTQLTNSYQANSRSPISSEDYLQLISNINEIDTEKETELIRRISESDNDAIRELVKANLWLVVSIAKQYQNMGLRLHDLILEGNLGLLSAVQRLVNSKDFNFSTYATGWIRQSILQAITENFWMSILKLDNNGQESRIDKVFHQLNRNFLCEPINDELSLKYA